MIRNTINTLFYCGEKNSPIKFPFSVFTTFFIVFSFAITASAQTNADRDEAFKNTLKQRSAKIVSALAISKKNKKEKITNIIANQYYQLNKVHDNNKEIMASIKESGKDSDEKSIAIKTAEENKTSSLNRLHKKFISRLHKKLTTEQIDKVKDGMTYNVLNVTYAAYIEMILSLTDAQKQKIYSWLKEAREKAMDEGSSDDKHKVFGKYKGRINNYLSAEGYDMKAEEKAWQQRLKDKRAKEAAGKAPQST